MHTLLQRFASCPIFRKPFFFHVSMLSLTDPKNSLKKMACDDLLIASSSASRQLTATSFSGLLLRLFCSVYKIVWLVVASAVLMPAAAAACLQRRRQQQQDAAAAATGSSSRKQQQQCWKKAHHTPLLQACVLSSHTHRQLQVPLPRSC